MTTPYDPQRPSGIEVNFNDAVAFFIELAALAILGIWAWQLFDDHRVRLRQLNAAIDRITERTGAPMIVPARFARDPARRDAASNTKERR